MFVLVSKVKANAVNRPPGYVQDVLSRGIVKNGKLLLTMEAYRELVAKYGDGKPATTGTTPKLTSAPKTPYFSAPVNMGCKKCGQADSKGVA